MQEGQRWQQGEVEGEAGDPDHAAAVHAGGPAAGEGAGERQAASSGDVRAASPERTPHRAPTPEPKPEPRAAQPAAQVPPHGETPGGGTPVVGLAGVMHASSISPAAFVPPYRAPALRTGHPREAGELTRKLAATQAFGSVAGMQPGDNDDDSGGG